MEEETVAREEVEKRLMKAKPVPLVRSVAGLLMHAACPNKHVTKSI